MKIILNSFNCSHILDLHSWRKLIKTKTKKLTSIDILYIWVDNWGVIVLGPVILGALRNCVPGPLIGWGHGLVLDNQLWAMVTFLSSELDHFVASVRPWSSLPVIQRPVLRRGFSVSLSPWVTKMRRYPCPTDTLIDLWWLVLKHE